MFRPGGARASLRRACVSHAILCLRCARGEVFQFFLSTPTTVSPTEAYVQKELLRTRGRSRIASLMSLLLTCWQSCGAPPARSRAGGALPPSPDAPCRSDLPLRHQPIRGKASVQALAHDASADHDVLARATAPSLQVGVDATHLEDGASYIGMYPCAITRSLCRRLSAMQGRSPVGRPLEWISKVHCRLKPDRTSPNRNLPAKPV